MNQSDRDIQRKLRALRHAEQEFYQLLTLHRRRRPSPKAGRMGALLQSLEASRRAQRKGTLRSTP
jgi:hypothetical protein